MNKSETKLGKIPWFLATSGGLLLKADVFANWGSRNSGIPILYGFTNYDEVESKRNNGTAIPTPKVGKTEFFFNPKFNYGIPVGPFPNDRPVTFPIIPWKN